MRVELEKVHGVSLLIGVKKNAFVKIFFSLGFSLLFHSSFRSSKAFYSRKSRIFTLLLDLSKKIAMKLCVRASRGFFGLLYYSYFLFIKEF